MAHSGIEKFIKLFTPFESKKLEYDLINGSVGTPKGSFTTINISNNSPGKSTPSQKLFVPNNKAFLCMCIPLIIEGLEAPFDWANKGISFTSDFSFILLETFSSILIEVNRTIVLF